MNSEIKHIHILFDFAEELEMLRRRFDSMGISSVEDEAIRSALTLLVTDVFDLSSDFAKESAFDTVIEYFRTLIDSEYDINSLRETIRLVDASISQKAYVHVPNFGANWYVGEATVRFVSSTHCVYQTAATIASDRSKPGAGGD